MESLFSSSEIFDLRYTKILKDKKGIHCLCPFHVGLKTTRKVYCFQKKAQGSEYSIQLSSTLFTFETNSFFVEAGVQCFVICSKSIVPLSSDMLYHSTSIYNFSSILRTFCINLNVPEHKQWTSPLLKCFILSQTRSTCFFPIVPVVAFNTFIMVNFILIMMPGISFFGNIT